MHNYFGHLVLLLTIVLFSCQTKNELEEIHVPGIKNPEILLNGTWKFTMQPPDNFWENHIDFNDWADILVPGECQMQGFAIQHDRPYVYKQEFDVPADYKGHHIGLNFYGVYSHARVWINGKYAEEHYGGFTKWTCDISELVTPGEKAVLTLEMTDRTDDLSYGSGYAKHQIGGILRDVELTAKPEKHFKSLYFETDLDDAFKDALLKTTFELNGTGKSTIQIDVMDPEGKIIATVEKETDQNKGEFSLSLQNPLKWDAEHPNLYTVITSLYDGGKLILKKSCRIGIREISIQKNKMLVNGQEVKLRGACRHDIHPTLGRMTTPEYDLKDVLLAKECNMNFIRTSHYPPSDQFLDYCDQYGLYVEDETAVCFVGSHRTQMYRESGATQDDPAYTDRYISQLREMVENHRNHPSVVIWSIGNENHFGSNFIASYDWVKANDTTRPVIYSYPGQVPDSLELFDIISMHYPDWRGSLNQYGVSTKGFESDMKPMLFDEWAHVSCYNNYEIKEDPNVRNFWSQSLDSMWTKVFDADGGLGGAIWCMLDETFMLPEELDGFNQWWGILDKNIIPSTFIRPTVGYGEWGIIDTWRRKKPEFWGTKKAYSPTKIYTRQINKFDPGKELAIPVHNRFDHTNFSELNIVWRYGEKSGSLKSVNLAPHERGTLIFPANDWNNSEALNIQFYQYDTLLVDEYNIRLGDRIPAAFTESQKQLNLTEEGDRLTLTGETFSVEIKNGLLENLSVNGNLLMKSGPYIHIKQPGKAVQYSTIQMDDIIGEWELTDFHYEHQDNAIRLYTEGQYGSIKARFITDVYASGEFKTSYEVTGFPDDKNIQALGIKFVLTDDLDQMAWDRKGYFTSYPKNHIGAEKGIVDLSDKPIMDYRSAPGHDWSMDSQVFYYFGIGHNLPYTHIARSLKENIYNYSVSRDSTRFQIVSNAKHAVQLDRIKGENRLMVNALWDYNSIGWGNYYKRIRLNGSFADTVMFKVE